MKVRNDFLNIFVIICYCLSFPIFAQNNSNYQPKKSNCSKYHPDLFVSNTLIFEEENDGIGHYYYSNAYLPDITRLIKTRVHKIDFYYKSFNEVRINIKFQNIFNKHLSQIYKNDELWKLNYYNSSSYESLFPFIAIYIPEHLDKSFSDVGMASSISQIKLINENDEIKNYKKDVNKIIYHPISYCKAFDYPSPENMKYVFFAGHNILLNIPLTEELLTLSFTITNYNFNNIRDYVTFNIPLLFCTENVEINRYNIISITDHKEEITIFPPIKKSYPIDAYIHKLHKNFRNILSIEDLGKKKKVLMITQLGSKIYTGKGKKINDIKNIHYKGISIINNNHKIGIQKGINLGLKKIDCPLPLSIYELLKKNSKVLVPPILDYFIYNNSDIIKKLKISSQILGLSYPEIKNIIVPPNSFQIIKFLPVLIKEKKQQIYAPRNYIVHSSIEDLNNSDIIFEKTNEIKVLPNDTMIFQMINESTGKTQRYYNYLVNWVRRIDSPRLDTLLKVAAQKTLTKYFFGYDEQGYKSFFKKGIINSRKEFTRHLVKAIYETLHSYKPIYSNETLDFGRTDYQFGQRIKYPKETLEQGRGNCIDSSILLASILETIGINPVIVIIPGHAFIGWETWENSCTYEYLESTFLGYYNFNAAYRKGMTEEKKYSRINNPPAIKYINVKKCRKAGIYSIQEPNF